jgi:predicted AAA+ superfamily ATPase
MITRTLHAPLLERARQLPVVVLTGPRQSGKTTLARSAFPDMPYVSLESPAEAEFARDNPVGFLSRYEAGAVIDEVQRVPELLSDIQVRVDNKPGPGQFILTGSQNLGVVQAVSQSLAGRSALLQLLPLSLEEVQRFPESPSQLMEVIWTGGYPRIHDQRLPPDVWLADYTATYVERDVRQVLKVGDLASFQTFLRICSGRIGQLLNLSGLGNDAGITHATAKSWLSVLEAGFIAFRLSPHHRNLGKRLIKTPKLYFYDTGLLCSLLGIEIPRQLETHPLRGAIFENWVVSELFKHFLHRGRRPHFFFHRDRRGREVDLIIEHAAKVIAIEIKSGATPASDYFDGLRQFVSTVDESSNPGIAVSEKIVIYGGDESQPRRDGTLLSWREIDARGW